MPDLQDALAPLGRMGMLSMSRCCLRGVPPAVVHMTSLLVSVAWIAPLLHSTSSLLLHPACFHFCGVSILLCVSSHCLLSPPSRPSTFPPATFTLTRLGTPAGAAPGGQFGSAAATRALPRPPARAHNPGALALHFWPFLWEMGARGSCLAVTLKAHALALQAKQCWPGAALVTHEKGTPCAHITQLAESSSPAI